MRCKQSSALLEEFLDGELGAVAAAEISAHLTTCDDCREALNELKVQQQLYQRHEPAIELSPRLWANVKSRITSEREAGLLNQWKTAFYKRFSLAPFNVALTGALVLLAVIGTVGVMTYLNRQESQPHMTASRPESNQLAVPIAANETSEQGTVTPLVGNKTSASRRQAEAARRKPTVVSRDGASQTAAQLVQEAEQKYLNAIALLNRDVHRHPSRLDAYSRARLDGALVDIDRTIAASRAAVKRNPNDPVAVQYMLAAYRKKVDVLREMTNY